MAAAGGLFNVVVFPSDDKGPPASAAVLLAPAEPVARGAYLAKHCVACHGSEGRSKAPANPPLAGNRINYPASGQSDTVRQARLWAGAQ
jgi:mono/diheme cytochrome c family protein